MKEYDVRSTIERSFRGHVPPSVYWYERLSGVRLDTDCTHDFDQVSAAGINQIRRRLEIMTFDPNSVQDELLRIHVGAPDSTWDNWMVENADGSLICGAYIDARTSVVGVISSEVASSLQGVLEKKNEPLTFQNICVYTYFTERITGKTVQLMRVSSFDEFGESIETVEYFFRTANQEIFRDTPSLKYETIADSYVLLSPNRKGVWAKFQQTSPEPDEITMCYKCVSVVRDSVYQSVTRSRMYAGGEENDSVVIVDTSSDRFPMAAQIHSSWLKSADGEYFNPHGSFVIYDAPLSLGLFVDMPVRDEGLMYERFGDPQWAISLDEASAHLEIGGQFFDGAVSWKDRYYSQFTAHIPVPHGVYVIEASSLMHIPTITWESGERKPFVAKI